MPLDPRADALQALARFLHAETTIGDTLLRVTEITCAALPAAEMAGITMLDERGRIATSVFTDPGSPEVDEAQYRSGRGPCLDAWREGRAVRIDDVSSASAYPEFAAAALAHGVKSTLSLPLVVGEVAAGALNLYANREGAFSDGDVDLGVELSGVAAVVLANASAYWAALQLGEQLQEAMQSRAIIEQAKGMLMSRSPDTDADAAFAILTRASQRENVKLRVIAQRIVDRLPVTGSEEDPSGP